MPTTSKTSTDSSTVEESSVKQTMELDAGPDIESLVSVPSARDRKRFKAFQLATPTLASVMTIDLYKANQVNEQIVDTVKSFMNAGPNLIRRLAVDVLHEPTIAQVRAAPSTYLQRLLNSAESQDLADRLLKKLKWYGGEPGEQTSKSVHHQLLCKAICLYLQTAKDNEPQELAGFGWKDPVHWGKSYQALREDFERHLLRTKRAATTKESILLARVFEIRLSKDFAVRDIPPELRYKTSVVWVNFMHGVLLAEETDSDQSQALTFQQLVNLPLERSVGASSEQLENIARLRISPALEWAICTGVIQTKTALACDQEDIKSALSALEEQSDRLNKAVMTLDLLPPDRLQMAGQVLADLFRGFTFDRDGRKLLSADPSYGGSRSTPPLKLMGHDFLDVYADGRLDGGKQWIVSQPDGKTRTTTALRLDDRRILYAELENSWGGYERVDEGVLSWTGKHLPDINAQFESEYSNYLATIRPAYQTLIASLLTSLPLDDRRALAQGEVQILSLREKPGPQGPSEQDRARKGFVLKATHNGTITYYELIPSAGFIRLRTGLRFSTVGGVYTEFPLHASIPGQSYSPERNHSTSLLLDWRAHLHGSAPAARASCVGFLDVMSFRPAVASSGSTTSESETTALTSRLNGLAQHIATHFLYVDEQHLRMQTRGMTTFDTARAKVQQRLEHFVAIVKGFVPFWGSIDDLLSDKTEDKIMGGIGLLLDLASFLCPIGKFMSGSVRLIKATAGTSRIAVKASLPSFSTLSRKLLTSSLSNLNPLDGIPSLLQGMLTGARTGLHFARLGSVIVYRRIRSKVHNFRMANNLPQALDPGNWSALTKGDTLATVNGVNDVLVRQTGLKRLHLVDPVTSLPYGPRLHNNGKSLKQGRSVFQTHPPTETHIVAQVPESASIREMLEVDGRTTLLIDDIPYRLDGDQLRRADLIDDQSMFKTVPCRVRRMPGSDVCRTSYVTQDPAPTPAIGSQDTSKGWADWFGDSIYTPAISTQPLLGNAIRTYKRLDASLEFQKGIYARIKVRLPYSNPKKFDTLETGAIIVPSIDETKHYVYTRLNAADFYVTERLPGQALSDPLVLSKAQTLPPELAGELKTVYTGSLNANNTVRIHGIAAVERALKTMEDIAIPLGTSANPPAGMKWLKVDTSPGEALMFDHSTRMIVAHRPEGATTWARSTEAPEAFRRRTAEIFDTLFLSPTISPVDAPGALRINDAMDKLQRLLHRFDRTDNPRNIAYAEVINANGAREVYVSVSGAQGTTKHLPVFRHLGTNHVKIGDTTYINVDFNPTVSATNLELTEKGQLVAIPLTIKDIDTYTPKLATRPTSLDSESKLIRVIREKYPDPLELKSVSVATTMPPCGSCAVLMKAFGHKGEAGALEVLWK
ncbi:hypothetical protein [Pseudomonas sp. SDO52101_S400]